MNTGRICGPCFFVPGFRAGAVAVELVREAECLFKASIAILNDVILPTLSGRTGIPSFGDMCLLWVTRLCLELSLRECCHRKPTPGSSLEPQRVKVTHEHDGLRAGL